MADCPVCGDAYDRFETVDTVEVRPGDEPGDNRLCVGGYKFRDETAGVRCYYHAEG